MSTTSADFGRSTTLDGTQNGVDNSGLISASVWGAMKVLGSLKLTVGLFAFSMVLVLVGTLAQEDLNMVEVKARYFTSWIAMTRLEDFIPQAFFPHKEPLTLVFPLPGGALVGVLLLINLVAAKITRFHVRATGVKLYAGLSIFIFGCLLCYFVVASGHSSDGVQGEPWVEYQTLWAGMVSGMAVLWLTAAYKAFTSERKGWRIIWAGIAVAFGALGIASLSGYFSMSVSSLRITWQLLQGTVVGLVMLVGSLLMFDKQGGNLLLHFGVALLMIGQFAFGDTQVEQRLSLVEGQSTNTFVRMDDVELVFVDRGSPDEEQITAVPGVKLERFAGKDEAIVDARLPVDVRVIQFFPNSDLKVAEEKTLATLGNGLNYAAVAVPSSGGVSSAVDLASGYIELIDKESSKSLGTWMVSQLLNDAEYLSVGRKSDIFDSITVGDKTFDIGLRFARVVKPYWVKVKDVQRTTYSGTQTPRDYSSFIKLVDSDSGEVRDERVWMNNPLRYRGETFYQSSYEQLEGGKEFTSIQVVRNTGWMIPYVACMIVAIGMMSHFTGTLDRFLGRQERSSAKLQPNGKPVRTRTTFGLLGMVCIGLVATVGSIPWSNVSTMLRPEKAQKEVNVYRAGEIPAKFGGRVMPLDAYARQTLRAISNRTSLPLTAADDELPPAPLEIEERAGGKTSLSAMQWLLEIAGGSDELRDLHMFRIDADEILNHFELDRRASKLYSLAELIPKFQEFDQELQAARKREPAEQTFKDAKFMELASRLNAFQQVESAFGRLSVPPLPPGLAAMEMTEAERTEARFMMLSRQMDQLEKADVAAIIPPTTETTTASIDFPPWMPYSVGRFRNIALEINEQPQMPGVKTFATMVDAYQDDDAETFNKAVDEHLAAVAEVAPKDYRIAAVETERYLEAVQPTFIARILYGFAVVLGLIALLVNSAGLRWTVWGGLIAVAVLHTFFLISRIYITGKAPVINLYSSAVFIGWAVVIAGLMLEMIYKRGIGNLIAAGSGLTSLMVAWALDKGDTMPVLEAVLDTQFWLSTHVITVTLGYAATFLAGGLGILYLGSRLFGDSKNELARDIYRMAYSATCFGILFSFVGTVLGGLWADDSWGRFWGWDPKENGALLIVIWNALMLHARWDGMIKDRGFAILAIVGNLVTAWSWFGTNQLGLGLHSYGGNSGAKMWLGIFLLSQLAIIALGLLVTMKPKLKTKE